MPWQRKGPPQRIANVREATRRKLDALRRRDRARTWLLAGLGASLVLALGYAVVTQSRPSTREVEGVVRVAAVRQDEDTGHWYMAIESQLDNGKIVRAAGLQAQPPRPGDRIVLTERTGWLGFHSYEWHGLKR